MSFEGRGRCRDCDRDWEIGDWGEEIENVTRIKQEENKEYIIS